VLHEADDDFALAGAVFRCQILERGTAGNASQQTAEGMVQSPGIAREVLVKETGGVHKSAVPQVVGFADQVRQGEADVEPRIPPMHNFEVE
jgi:hypothetical protein